MSERIYTAAEVIACEEEQRLEAEDDRSKALRVLAKQQGSNVVFERPGRIVVTLVPATRAPGGLVAIALFPKPPPLPAFVFDAPPYPEGRAVRAVWLEPQVIASAAGGFWRRLYVYAHGPEDYEAIFEFCRTGDPA